MVYKGESNIRTMIMIIIIMIITTIIIIMLIIRIHILIKI